MKQKLNPGTIAHRIIGTLTLCLCWQAVFTHQAVLAAPKTNAAPKLIVEEAPLAREVKIATSYAPIIKKVAPSVVNIYSTMTVRERSGSHPFLDDPLLRRFFGDPGQSRPRRESGLGSGVIVSADGYILTANHVVDGADSVKVALASGEKEFDAKIIGTDPATDVAVLKLDLKRPLPAITIADSDKLEVGDMVLAVGNPFGVGQTVTMGIVSGLSRGGFGVAGYENFIQTDAAINPGNSGGALVDAQGRLIGINTLIMTGSGGSQGVGFAVPVNMARFVMDRLVASGKVSRGYLGINIQSLTPDLAKAFNLPDESSGVLVGGVAARGPAEKAGLQDGDIITELDGKKMTDSRVLQLTVAQTAPGTKVTLRLLRSDAGRKPAEKTVNVVLGELPAGALGKAGAGGLNERKSQETDALDGVEVSDLDARTRRQLDVPSQIQGALVASVDPNSNAAEAGVRQGDVILEINHEAVRSADEAVRLSEKATGDQILLRIWSQSSGMPGGGSRFLAVDNTKRKK